MAREALFGVYNHNTSMAHVATVLKSAAARGSEEADGLLGMMRSEGDIPEFRTRNALLSWLARVTASDDSPLGRYYHGRALLARDDDVVGRVHLREAAEGGFVPAFAELGKLVPGRIIPTAPGVELESSSGIV